MGAILLAGYGGEVGLRETSLEVVGAAEGSGEETWLIEISGDLPYGEEPLVLAALLKLLLSKGPLGVRFDFAVEDVLAELGWQDRRFARDVVDNAVRRYTCLSYARRREAETEARGMYTLVTGYDQITDAVTEGSGRARLLDRVHFHPYFIGGLRNFRITFAGIDFGALRSAEYYGTETDTVM